MATAGGGAHTESMNDEMYIIEKGNKVLVDGENAKLISSAGYDFWLFLLNHHESSEKVANPS